MAYHMRCKRRLSWQATLLICQEFASAVAMAAQDACHFAGKRSCRRVDLMAAMAAAAATSCCLLMRSFRHLSTIATSIIFMQSAGRMAKALAVTAGTGKISFFMCPLARQCMSSTRRQWFAAIRLQTSQRPENMLLSAQAASVARATYISSLLCGVLLPLLKRGSQHVSIGWSSR